MKSYHCEDPWCTDWEKDHELGDARRRWKRAMFSRGDEVGSMRLIMGQSHLTSVPLWKKSDANQIVDFRRY
jgi:hypothetical protein